MNIHELVKEAETKGYTQIDDGADTYDLNNFIDAYFEDEDDYAVDYNGVVRRYNAEGFEESAPCFRLLK